MATFKPLIPNEYDLKNPTSNGFITIKKSAIIDSTDPEALRKELSEQYTRIVQEYPHLDFGILVDGRTDDITISWVPAAGNPRT
jgi:hypothetical protein